MNSLKQDPPRCRIKPSLPCDDRCAYKRMLGVLGKKHTLDILRIIIYDQPVRFTALQKELKGSSNTLTDRLQELCELDILTRVAFAEIPPRVEYSLTEKGMKLVPVMESLREWTKQWRRIP